MALPLFDTHPQDGGGVDRNSFPLRMIIEHSQILMVVLFISALEVNGGTQKKLFHHLPGLVFNHGT